MNKFLLNFNGATDFCKNKKGKRLIIRLPFDGG